MYLAIGIYHQSKDSVRLNTETLHAQTIAEQFANSTFDHPNQYPDQIHVITSDPILVDRIKTVPGKNTEIPELIKITESITIPYMTRLYYLGKDYKVKRHFIVVDIHDGDKLVLRRLTKTMDGKNPGGIWRTRQITCKCIERSMPKILIQYGSSQYLFHYDNLNSRMILLGSYIYEIISVSGI